MRQKVWNGLLSRCCSSFELFSPFSYNGDERPSANPTEPVECEKAMNSLAYVEPSPNGKLFVAPQNQGEE